MIAFPPSPSCGRTEATERAYRRRADHLLRRWRRERGRQEGSPFDFAVWLLDRLRTVKPASFRQYKAAVMIHLPQAFARGEALDQAMELLRAARARPNRHLPARTSARKMRHLPQEDWERLRARLLKDHAADGSSHPANAGVISLASIEAWCRATLLCALRPTEWAKAEFRDKGAEFVVIVRNAKATQGRSHGETRSLVFEGLDETDRKAIRDTIGLAAAWAARGRSAALQKLVADGLYRAARAALGRREAYPSLYTFRHQAIANWKTERDALEVAALCGHARTETAARHYAARRHAWRGARPKAAMPSAADVQAVRLLNPSPAEPGSAPVPSVSVTTPGR